jgi:hypothetical protein
LQELLNLLGLSEVQLTVGRCAKDHLKGVHLQLDFPFRRTQPSLSYRESHDLLASARDLAP